MKIQDKKRGNWDSIQLNNALWDIRNGTKIRSAARTYHVPESNKRTRINNNLTNSPKLGRKPVFSKEQEKAIADRLKNAANMFCGVTPNNCRKAAFSIAKTCKIKNKFNKEQKMAVNVL